MNNNADDTPFPDSRGSGAIVGKNAIIKDEVDATKETLRAVQLGKLFHLATMHADEAAILIDPYTGIVVFANAIAERFFRLPDGSIKGKTIDRLYPHNRAQLYLLSEEAIENGCARSRKLNLYRPDGNLMRAEHLAQSICQGDKTLLLLRIIDLDAFYKRDVNEAAETYLRKGLHQWLKDEQYLKEIERQYQLILAAAGEGIYGVNAEGLTTFLNPAAEKMLGYAANELIGYAMHDIIHHKHQDGSHYPKDLCPIYNAFKEGKVNKVDNEVFWRKDGTAIPIEYTSTPINDSGKVVGAVIVFRDMTERRKNEQRLRSALIDNAALKERLEMENAYLQEEILSHRNHHNIIGNSEPLKALLAQIDLVAPTDANVLIQGESGTGKELIAHAIHRASSRADRPLIRVNCAAIPRELFESEFFGHVKGSFSGAVSNRIGRFELADGGTLFLDEVGELELSLQAKLLRVIQEGVFERVGEANSRSVDVRLITATNRDLKLAAEAGDFREDLYFRLNVFPIECVPLRQRLSDVPMLAEHYLNMTAKRLKIKPPRLTRANARSLMNYAWPGNVRELQNVVERAVIVSNNGKLSFQLPDDTQSSSQSYDQSTTQTLESIDKILTLAELAEFETKNIQRAVDACNGRIAGPNGAAKLLGIRPTTLYSRLKKKIT